MGKKAECEKHINCHENCNIVHTYEYNERNLTLKTLYFESKERSVPNINKKKHF